MTKSSKKANKKVEDLIEILKYFSQTLKVKIAIEKFTQNDTFKDIYRKFQICIIKYLQGKSKQSQEYENALKLFKIFTRVFNSCLEPGDSALNADVEKEWDDLMTKKSLSRSSRAKV
jgi:alpha-amylase/alpha-mannosidase (GH57 family)